MEHLEILLLGNSGVGKTTFLNNLLKRSRSVSPTEGIKKIILTLKDNRKVRIWDPSGHLQGEEINDYIRLAHFVVIMIDLSQPEQYKSTYKWLAKAELYLKSKKNILLVGTKADKAILTRNHITLYKSFGLKYIESSSNNPLPWKRFFEILKSYVI